MWTVNILNYNGKDILEKCVRSVLNQSFKPDRIQVIDNSSTDESWKLVENDVDKVIHADNRLQFISGLNDAFENSENGFVTFMENDVLLHPDYIHDVTYTKAHISSPKFYDQFGNNYKVEWYSGFLSACFTMRKETFDYIGKFDENLAPAYWEDVDYSIRAKRLGFKCKKNIGKAVHYANYSFSKVFSKKQMSGWCRRNAWYVLRKLYLGGYKCQ